MGHLCSYGQVSECFPEDETNDQFNEMSKAKEQLLDDIFEVIKPLVEKINAKSDDNTDKVLAQNDANTNKICAEVASGFEEMMNKLKLNSGTGEY